MPDAALVGTQIMLGSIALTAHPIVRAGAHIVAIVPLARLAYPAFWNGYGHLVPDVALLFREIMLGIVAFAAHAIRGTRPHMMAKAPLARLAHATVGDGGRDLMPHGTQFRSQIMRWGIARTS